MELLNFVGVLIGIFGLLYILEKQLKKWFAIEREVLESETAKKIERWNRWTFGVVQVLLIPLMFQNDEVYIYWMIIIFTAITAITVYVEWRLLKGTRKYQLSLATYGLFMFAILAMLSLWE